MSNLNPKQFEPFVAATNSVGGATLDVDSGELIGNSPEGPHGYIVGGEMGISGKRVSTRYIPKKSFTPSKAHKTAEELMSEADTTSPGLGIGSYVDPKAGENAPVEMDVSRNHSTLKEAMHAARQRGEKSVWSTKLQQEIRTDDYFKDPKKYHDLVGEPL